MPPKAPSLASIASSSMLNPGNELDILLIAESIPVLFAKPRFCNRLAPAVIIIPVIDPFNAIVSYPQITSGLPWLLE